MENKNNNWGVAVVVVGVFLILGIVFLKSGIDDKDKGVKINAVIDEIVITTRRSGRRGTTTDYDVYINYEYKGEKYEDIRYNDYSSSMDEGDKIEIKINENNPEEIYYSTQEIKIGCFFLGLAIFVIVIIILSLKQQMNQDCNASSISNINYEGSINNDDNEYKFDIEKNIDVSNDINKLFRS